MAAENRSRLLDLHPSTEQEEVREDVVGRMGSVHTCSEVSSVSGVHADASASGADTSAPPPPVNLRTVAGPMVTP